MTTRVIVTGATSGIGRATAELLRKEAVELALVGRRAEVLQEVAASVGAVHWVVADLGDPSQARRVFEEARSDAYPVLINAAGMAEFGEFDAMPWDEIERQIAVNMLGPIALCHAAIPWMLEQGGQIVNVLSVAATHVFSQSLAYGVSKAGLHMAGKSIAAEYRTRGVRVTSILPGAVDTPIWEGKSFVPNREEMLPVSAVAEAIRDLVLMPRDRNVDEIALMPPKGIL